MSYEDYEDVRDSITNVDSLVWRKRIHRAPTVPAAVMRPVVRNGGRPKGFAADHLSEAQATVLAALGSVPLRAAAVARATGLTKSTVAGALRALGEKGLATRSNTDGTWRAAE